MARLYQVGGRCQRGRAQRQCAHMRTWDTERILALMLEAGRIALQHVDNPEIDTKSDASIVTAADHAIERFFIDNLVEGEPDVALIGEETCEGMSQADVDAAMAGVSWVVDPIDGTAPYANGLANWGVSLARMEAGTLTDGALFLPHTGELFITDGPNVRYKLGARNPTYWAFDDVPIRPAGPIPYRASGMVSLPQEVSNNTRYSGRNPMQSIGSAVYSVAKVITGAYLCYVARVKLWDLAGSIPILDRLGFQIVLADGRPLGTTVSGDLWHLNNAEGRLWKAADLMFIASADETVSYLREHVRPRG